MCEMVSEFLYGQSMGMRTVHHEKAYAMGSQGIRQASLSLVVSKSLAVSLTHFPSRFLYTPVLIVSLTNSPRSPPLM